MHIQQKRSEHEGLIISCTLSSGPALLRLRKMSDEDVEFCTFEHVKTILWLKQGSWIFKVSSIKQNASPSSLDPPIKLQPKMLPICPIEDWVYL